MGSMGPGSLPFDPMDYPRVFRAIINLWPPYLGAGIAVRHIAPDWRSIRVEMKLRWYNRNYVHSHFGGNLFSMTDPFYMLMLMRNLGRDYIVWDTAAKIAFLTPGRGRVTARFHLSDERLAEIIARSASGEKLLERFRVEIIDERGEKVASVRKTLYIKRKGVKKENCMTEEKEEPMAETVKTSPRILSSGWGKMTIDGLGRGKDFKLWPGGGREWDWAENGTDHGRGIQPGDVEELIRRGCKTIILTTGRMNRLRIAPETLALLGAKKVETVVAGTREGIDRYNEYAQQGRPVGGLFHSTC